MDKIRFYFMTVDVIKLDILWLKIKLNCSFSSARIILNSWSRNMKRIIKGTFSDVHVCVCKNYQIYDLDRDLHQLGNVHVCGTICLHFYLKNVIEWMSFETVGIREYLSRTLVIYIRRLLLVIVFYVSMYIRIPHNKKLMSF